MHVRVKQMAAAGLLAAVTVVMMVLGSVIETNSLFFIAAASYCIGIAIREWDVRYGFVFFLACMILNLMLAPNKLHCITFAGMGFYLWLSEVLWKQIAHAKELTHRTARLWIGKYVIFNIIYIPILIFMPSLIFTKEVTSWIVIILFLFGQAALFVYDLAYRYFQSHIWGKIRLRLVDKRNF